MEMCVFAILQKEDQASPCFGDGEAERQRARVGTLLGVEFVV